MKTSTHTLELTATKSAAFAFLSQVENLPKWATQFCTAVRRDADGRVKVVTPNGELFFRIVGDSTTGVVDMFGGPTEDQMAYWPARVVDRPGAGSLFTFTAMQYPGISDADFVRQCQGLEHEFQMIRRHLDDAPAI